MPRIFKWFGWLLEFVVLTCGLASLAAFADGYQHLAYVIVCFRFQLLLGLLASAVGLCLLKKWRWLTVCLLLAIPDAVAVLPCFYTAQQPLHTMQKNLRICQINLNCGNTQHERAVQYIRARQPDILLLQEVSPPWLASLSAKLPDYPYRLVETRWDPFGVAIFSRCPLTNGEIKHFAKLPLPTAIACIRWNGTNIKLIDVHALPILSSRLLATHRRQIEEFATEASSDPGLTVLAGDFNTTAWSSSMQSFQRSTSFKRCADGFGWVPTWPRSLEQWGHPDTIINNSLLMLPIDQCFVSPSFRVTAYSVGGNIGSDHSPICIDLSM